MKTILGCTFALLVMIAHAHAEEPGASAPAPAPAAEPAIPLAGTHPPVLLQLPWSMPSGTGVGIGMEIGSWGRGGMITGLRVRVPFGFTGGHWCAVARGLFLSDLEQTDRLFLGGRLEVQGQSDVLLNVIRIYGGGGPSLLVGVGSKDKKKLEWGGGGQFGFEFFQAPHVSTFIEIGGTGGPSGFRGATVAAGVNLYLP